MRRAAAAVVLTTLALSPITPAMGQEQEVTVRSDLLYGTAGGAPLLMDAFLPPGAGPHPGVIVIPGGQWAFKDKDDVAVVAGYLAELGYAAFAVSYRPATDFPYPAPVRDVQRAVRWVRDQASEFGVDPARLGAVGGSSGGHLAALLATLGEGPLDAGSRVAVAASWSGPMDLTQLLDVEATREPVMTFLGCRGAADCLAEARAASPEAHIDATDAPMYIANSTDEVIPFDQATSMADALEGSDVAYELRAIPGDKHAAYGETQKFLDTLSVFLGRWLLAGGAGESGSAAGDERAGSKSLSPDPSARPGTTSGDSSIFGMSTRSMAVVVVFGAALLLVIAIQTGVILRSRRRSASEHREGP